MNRKTLIAGAALVPALFGVVPQEHGTASRPERMLWIFFSMAETDLRADLAWISQRKRAGALFGIRPCLLLENPGAIKSPKQVHVENVKALSELVGPGFELPLLDEEGLSMARALGIERLPAFCLVDSASRRAHVAYGRGAHLGEVFRCE